MEKITRQWVLLVLCSVCFACAPDAGKLSKVSPPPQPNPSQVSAAPEATELAVAKDPDEQAPPATTPASEQEFVAADLPVKYSPRSFGQRHEVYPPADEPVFDPPSSTITHLAGEAPEIAMEALPAAEDELALIDELNEVAIPDDFDLETFRQERLKNTESELPIVLNEQVAKFINYFTGSRGKKTVVNTLQRAGAFREMIERILEEEGVPAEMFHLAQAESGFRPKARSRAHATGMWQFMKFRGRQYGLREDKYVDERYDPEKATRAAARHLLDLYIEFGDWYLAMAAYNGGPNRIKRAVERTDSKDFWEHSRRRFLRRETSNYVPIILAMTYVGKNLDMYGIEIDDPAPPLEYDTIETDSEIHLDLIADITDTTAETIKQLNPALLRSATPPYSYDLRLPKGTGETFLSRLEAIPTDKRLAWRRHEVQDGESLAAVAKRYRVDESQILAHNSIEGDGLEPGDWITIPAPPARLSNYGSSEGGAGGFVESGTGRYRIARGDNLGSISSRFGVSIANLRQWNGLSSTRITAGRYLIVKPEGAGEQASSVGSTPPRNAATYRIRNGDTLGTIARRHSVSVAQLKAWNGLNSNRIQAGDEIVVGERTQPAPAAARASDASSSASADPGSSDGKYRIRRGDNLATIANRFGVTVNDLKEWNRLRSTRIGAGEYLIVRPSSQKAAASSPAPTKVSSAPPVNGSAQKYRIQRGDNLAGIAERFGVEVDDLKQWNNLRGTRITAGEQLIVGTGTSQRANSTRATTARVENPAPQPARSATPAEYTIQRGDNLGAIAERFSVDVADLQQWNGLRGTRITAGQTLKLRPGAGTPARPQLTVASAGGGTSRYQIQRGDTLADIAKRFGVSVRDLMAWNGLNDSRIHEGGYLTVVPSRGGDGGS